MALCPQSHVIKNAPAGFPPVRRCELASCQRIFGFVGCFGTSGDAFSHYIAGNEKGQRAKDLSVAQ